MQDKHEYLLPEAMRQRMERLISPALRAVIRDNVSFFIVAIVVIGFMVAMFVDFTGRASACKYEPDGTQQYFCYLNTSVREHDLRICNEIARGDERNGCFMYYAIQTKDFGPCALIATSRSKDFCHSNIAFVKRDSELCLGVFSKAYRDGCYERLALIERNESICLSMSSGNSTLSCIAYVERMIAEQKKVE